MTTTSLSASARSASATSASATSASGLAAWNHNLGPLTTTAIFPSHCSSNFYGGNSVIFQGQSCRRGIDDIVTLQDDTACWPSRSGPAATTFSEPPLNGWGFYSPGLACPSGYTTACTQTGGGASDYVFQFSPSASETAFGCCPTAPGSPHQTCISFNTNATFAPELCTGRLLTQTTVLAPNTITLSLKRASSTRISIVTVSTITQFAPMIQLIRRDGDVLPTNTAGADQNARALSSGAIAGIVIAVIVIVLGVISGGMYCWAAARRKRNVAAQDANADVYNGGSEQGSFQDLAKINPAEVEGDVMRLAEMPARGTADDKMAAELAGAEDVKSGKPAELQDVGHKSIYAQGYPGQAVELP